METVEVGEKAWELADFIFGPIVAFANVAQDL